MKFKIYVLVSIFILGGERSRAYCLSDLDTISTNYVHDIPAEYKDSFLAALAHFPDLQTVDITFLETKIETTLNARPTLASVFKNKKDYIIRINNDQDGSPILLQDVPFEAQVGLFGHELSHFSDYESKGLFGVIGRAFDMAGKKSRAEFEKSIDHLTIEHGLGEELYEWSHYVLHDSEADEDYINFKRSNYLTPSEILAAANEIK
ncbi:MAG: hypothetical protein OCD76_12385 [Reichenbachiella sp.]